MNNYFSYSSRVVQLVAVLFIISGCAVTGGSTEPVRDTSGAYLMHTTSPWATNAYRESIEDATKFCRHKDKELIVISRSGGQVESSMRFYCR